MSLKARTFWAAIILLGCGVTGRSLWTFHLQSSDLPRLILYVIAAASTSGLKVRLPGIYSTLSMNYVFIIAGLLDLHVGSGILIGVVGVVCQSFYKCKERPKFRHLSFNLAVVSLSIAAAGLCFSEPWLRNLDQYGICSIVTASLAFFYINTTVLSIMIATTSDKSAFKIWKESYLWTFPQYVVGGVIATCFHLLLNLIGWVGMIFVLPAVYLVYRSYSIYLTRIEEQQQHINEMAQLHLRTIEALALAIDAKDDTTASHLRRVQVYASEIGKELGLSPLEMQALNAAAILHDIGKLAVPEYIISKPGRLTPDEFEKMKIHPIVGGEILERVDFPYPVVPIVRSHHEKYDGSGYPDGLVGEDIPIGARILSAVDCLDALASDRQYRKAMPLDDAIDIIIKESGTSFDPKIVHLLAARYRELEAKAKSETASTAKLSNNIKVERGARPATGFAEAPVTAVDSSARKHNFRVSISDARREFQMLLEMANDLGSSLSLNERLALLSVRLEKIVEHDAMAVYVREGNELVARHTRGDSYRLFSSLRIPVGQGLSGWVAENDVPIVNGNPSVEAGYLNDPTKHTHLRSAICVPLKSNDQVVGVLALYSLLADAFTQDHRRILVNVSGRVGSVVYDALRFEQVQNAARTDELTGLLNSGALFDELTQQVKLHEEHRRSLAVVVMDLNGFKKTNDEHGHLAGNRILQHVGQMLRRFSRSSDIVARLGGDEFVLVFSEPGRSLDAVLERISQEVSSAPGAAGTTTPLSMSIGYAIYPDDAADPEALLEIADSRMYEDKRRTKAAMAATTQVIPFPKPVTKPAGADPSNDDRARLEA